MSTPIQSKQPIAQDNDPPCLVNIDTLLEEIEVDSRRLQQSLKRKIISNPDIGKTIRTVCRKMSGLTSVKMDDLRDLANRTQIKYDEFEDDWEDLEVTEHIESILEQFSDAFFSAHPEMKDALFEEIREESEVTLGNRLKESSDKEFFLTMHVISILKRNNWWYLYHLFGVGDEAEDFNNSL